MKAGVPWSTTTSPPPLPRGSRDVSSGPFTTYCPRDSWPGLLLRIPTPKPEFDEHISFRPSRSMQLVAPALRPGGPRRQAASHWPQPRATRPRPITRVPAGLGPDRDNLARERPDARLRHVRLRGRRLLLTGVHPAHGRHRP